MPGSARPHRDTLAFVLAIIGATLWAAFPASALLRDNGVGSDVGFPLVMGAGALLGSWAGTSLWRHVAWPTPAVAAALVAAVVLGVRQEARGASPLGTIVLSSVVSAGIGAVVGARLGWRTRLPQRALLTACIAISGPAILMLSIAVASILGYDAGGSNALVWLVMLSIIPAAAIATWLGGAVMPERFAGWLFAMLTFAFGVSLHDHAEYGPLQGALRGALLAGILTFLATLPVLRRFHRPEAREDLPSARVIDR